MARKSFTTSAEPSNDRLKIVEFELDGEVLQARRPKTASFLALAEIGEDGDPMAQVRGVLSFMEDCLVADSREVVQARLDDPDDEFDLADMVPVVNWLTQEFTSRPTGRPSGSSPPRKRTGRRSTAPAPSTASTPNGSEQTDS